MCTLCRTEVARDPWAVCLDCVILLPAWARPPTLSPLGVEICLVLRDMPALLPEQPPGDLTGPALTGVHVPGVGVVNVVTALPSPPRRSRREYRPRRWAA